MGNINEISVLEFYIEQIHLDAIEFLKGRDSFKASIEELVEALKNEDNMHVKIQTAKKLWKALFEASMSYIDPDKSGYDRLFKYFDQYVDFEELIFASDSFYRDHTLHCLWVYFLGEYIARNEEFYSIVGDYSKEYNDASAFLENLKKLNNDGTLDENIKANEVGINMLKAQDSVRCITALTHDLGYPLKKIYRINKCIKDILPFYDIENYDEFNFNYSVTQQNFVSNFIEFLSWDLRLSTSIQHEDKAIEDKLLIMDEYRRSLGIRWDEINKATPDEIMRLKKTFIMDQKIMHSTARKFRYANDFEKYQHGIMSAFLLMKNINAFRKANISYYDNLHVPSYHNNYYDVIVKKIILIAITDHTSEGYQIKSIAGLLQGSAFLTFVDELEEFSRISRANQNRQYVNEFCKTDIYMEEGWLNIDFIFSSTEIDNLDPEIAFKGRCKKFLTLFNIPELDPALKIKLRCIGKLPYDDNTYTLEIARKYAKIMINDVEQEIPRYLKTNQFYTREEYMRQQG